jgi:hypothetical protein
MIVTVQLTPEIEAEILEAATERAAERILAEVLLTIKEACAMLKVSTATLNRLPIHRVKLGGATRYRRADIIEHIEASLER